MTAEPFADIIGLAAAILLPATVLLALRRRVRLHEWTGYAIVALSVAHTMASMYTPAIHHSSRLGLRFAMAALLVVVVQLFVGVALKSSHALRRTHFRLMLVTFAVVVPHVVLNWRNG